MAVVEKARVLDAMKAAARTRSMGAVTASQLQRSGTHRKATNKVTAEEIDELTQLTNGGSHTPAKDHRNGAMVARVRFSS